MNASVNVCIYLCTNPIEHRCLAHLNIIWRKNANNSNVFHCIRTITIRVRISNVLDYVCHHFQIADQILLKIAMILHQQFSIDIHKWFNADFSTDLISVCFLAVANHNIRLRIPLKLDDQRKVFQRFTQKNDIISYFNMKCNGYFFFSLLYFHRCCSFAAQNGLDFLWFQHFSLKIIINSLKFSQNIHTYIFVAIKLGRLA